jgi:cytochrome c oxidase cbb3-type subunit 3
MPGHTYDGIREYDNPMPGWWIWLFIATIIFSPVYLVGVHVFGFIDSYYDDFEEAGARLEAVRETYAASGPAFPTDEGALREYAEDPAMAEGGAAVFQRTCASCHGDAGQGGIGPNLTDEYWLHGAGPEAVWTAIAGGFPALGMPAWEGQLSDEERAQAMAFVISLQGTEPPNPKPPQGELVLF